MNKHTKGHWQVGDNGVVGVGQIGVGDFHIICKVLGDVDEISSNAQLISAAPALLEACLAMAELSANTEMTYEDAYSAMFKGDGRDAWNKVYVAIANATGETA